MELPYTVKVTRQAWELEMEIAQTDFNTSMQAME